MSQVFEKRTALISVFALVLLAAMFVQWSNGAGPAVQGAQPGGLSDTAGVTGRVQWSVFDSSGALKSQSGWFNTVNANAIDEVFDFIVGNAATGTYDAIVALKEDSGTDDPSDGIDAASLALTLDGDTGTAGDQNPADDDTLPTPTAGDGSIIVTFAASASTTIKQIALTKAAEQDTSAGQALIADDDIFAYIDVPDITLGSGDSVQYTWTIDVD